MKTRRPRVLYLAFYFPPSRASGVYRARATANYLAEQDWDVTTYACPLWFLKDVVGSLDEGLVETVDPRIRVERPEMNPYPWQQNLHEFSRFRAAMPLLAQRAYKWSQNRIFPEQYASWALAAVRRALRQHASQRFDLVVATGNPFASFAAGWLFNRLTRVPYVIDYRDSWTLDLFIDGPGFPDEHPVWSWEKRILRNASAIVFVNSALREWHANRYPGQADRMMVVPNGWDPDLLQIDMSVDRSDQAAEQPLRYGYLGTVTNNQPVEELVEAFRRARAHPDLAGAELNIHGHLGFFRNSPEVLRQRLGLDAGTGAGAEPVRDIGLRLRGPVPKTEVASVYEQNDVLVFLAAGARYVTSGKIFEYMASGRPIVSVHAPEIAAREVLEGYPLWFNANSLDVDEIAHSMVSAGKAARDLTAGQREAARQHADGYARQLLLAPLEERMRSFVRRSQARGQG